MMTMDFVDYIYVCDGMMCRVDHEIIRQMGGWANDMMTKHYTGHQGAPPIGLLASNGFGNCQGKDLSVAHFNQRAYALVGIDAHTIANLVNVIYPFLHSLKQKVKPYNLVSLIQENPL